MLKVSESQIWEELIGIADFTQCSFTRFSCVAKCTVIKPAYLARVVKMQRSGRNQLHARFTLLRTLARDVCLNGTNRRVPFNSSSPRQNCDRCRDVYQPVKSSRLFNGLEWWDFIPERARLPACRRTRADRVAFFSGGKSKASVWVLFPVAGFVSTDQHLPSGRAERTVCSVSAADIYYWIPSLSVLVYWASRMGTMSPLCVATMLFKSTFVHWLRMFASHARLFLFKVYRGTDCAGIVVWRYVLGFN